MLPKTPGSMLDTAPMPPRIAGTARAAATRHHVLVLHHDGTVERFSLQPGRPVVIGREPPADIVVCHPTVSRRHARLTVVEGKVIVDDLGSRNGTDVDGERVEHAVLSIGQEVALGDVIASVEVSTEVELLPGGFERHDTFVTLVDQQMRCARFFGGGGALVFLRVAPGHDAAFRRACAQINNLLRPVDRVALYSAEGIEVLLPEATLEQAVDLARRMRAMDAGSANAQVGVAMLTGTQGLAEDVIADARDAARDTPPGAEVGVFKAPETMTWSSDDTPSGRRLLQSPGLAATLDLARRVARAAVSVLVIGETGTGKELFARFLHETSPRAGKPMVAVNCGAIPRELLESTLFGHEKGAFTGAAQARRGVFEAADRGTVFLDEIGELSAGAQAALLRVLETRHITRVGSTQEIPVDVRIVAATHRDLETMCAQGTFREDLMFRLNTVVIEIPPLRARREDIAVLAEHFLREANRANGRSLVELEEEALSLLLSYAWPGNARELRNAIERAVVVATGDRVAAGDLPDRVRGGRGAPSSGGPASVRDLPSGSPPAPDSSPSLRGAIEHYEADVVRRTLEETGWNVTEAARRLDTPLRTFQHKLKRLGLRRPP